MAGPDSVVRVCARGPDTPSWVAAILSSVQSRVLFCQNQRLDMRLNLDLIPLVPASGMNRNTVDPIEDLNFAAACDQRQGFSQMGMSDWTAIRSEYPLCGQRAGGFSIHGSG